MRGRTADLLITSEMLYQLSYTSSQEKSNKSGAWGRNRTTDTMIFNHVLYQLSYPGTGPEAKQRPAGEGIKHARQRNVKPQGAFFPFGR